MVTKDWMNQLAAVLPISTSSFPEHALPRICLDYFLRRRRRPTSRPGLLSHQIAICKPSCLCSQRAPSEHRGACVLKKEPVASLHSQKKSVRQQAVESYALPQQQPGMHTHGELSTVQGCGQLTGTVLKQQHLQREV